ncbi:TldD/PmbA family protein [Reinekea forsetii]|nr:TldD/PmbA family protein [Reinekea forsetii]
MQHSDIQKVLDQVSAAGASGDLIVDGGESVSLKANAGALEEHAVRSSQILGLRVIKDQKVGIAYSEATDEEAITQLVNQALTNASYSEINADESLLGNQAQLVTDDAVLAPKDTTSIEEKIEFALALEAQLLKKDKIQSVPYNGVTHSTSTRSVYSTAGLSAQSKASSAVAYAYALAADGDKNAMSGIGQASRQFTELNVESIVEPTWEDCMALLKGTPVPTKHYDVIFDPNQQADIFDVFTMALSGKSAKDGLNPWREKLGKTVADERLSLIDSPTNTDGFGYQLFDVEGVACRDVSIISQGSLSTLLHNSATAHYFGIESTGHASRSPKSALSVGAHQLVVGAGDANKSELEQGEYLYITELSGTHSGANAISGDFSFGASGYLCNDGERLQPVRGITIAGNFYDMLKRITCIGDTQHWNWQRSSLMASIRFADLAVSGS